MVAIRELEKLKRWIEHKINSEFPDIGSYSDARTCMEEVVEHIDVRIEARREEIEKDDGGNPFYKGKGRFS